MTESIIENLFKNVLESKIIISCGLINRNNNYGLLLRLNSHTIIN